MHTSLAPEYPWATHGRRGQTRSHLNLQRDGGDGDSSAGRRCFQEEGDERRWFEAAPGSRDEPLTTRQREVLSHSQWPLIGPEIRGNGPMGEEGLLRVQEFLR